MSSKKVFLDLQALSISLLRMNADRVVGAGTMGRGCNPGLFSWPAPPRRQPELSTTDT